MLVWITGNFNPYINEHYDVKKGTNQFFCLKQRYLGSGEFIVSWYEITGHGRSGGGSAPPVPPALIVMNTNTCPGGIHFGGAPSGGGETPGERSGKKAFLRNL